MLDAALSLFAEQSYRGTTVPQIAEQAQVGIGTVYRHFGDKEGLVNALYQRQFAEMECQYQQVDHTLPFRQRFSSIFFAFSAWIQVRPQVVKFLEWHDHSAYLTEESWACKRKFIDHSQAFIREGQAQGLVKSLPPMLLLALIWGMQLELFRAQMLGLLELTEDDLAAAEQCAWEAIRA